MFTDNEKYSDMTSRTGKTETDGQSAGSPKSDASYKLPEEICLAARELAGKLNTLAGLLKEKPEFKIPGAVTENLTEQSDELRRLILKKHYKAGISEPAAECGRLLKSIKAENLSRGPVTQYDEEYYNDLIKETALYEKGLDDNTVQRPGSLHGHKFRRHKKDDTAYILTRRGHIEKIIYLMVFLIFIIHSLSLFMPVVWMFVTSFKNKYEYFDHDPFKFPQKWLWENYRVAFDILNVGETNFFGLIFNSLWWTVTASFLNAFLPSVTGYIMSKFRFPGRNFIFTVAIASMMIPIVGNMAAEMQVVHLLGIYDNPLFVVVTHLGGFSGCFLVYYGFFNSVSNAYSEAATIDGAGSFNIFFRIMLPQALSIIMTYLITGAIAHWNEYMKMILYLPSYPTLASGLFEYKEAAIRGINYPVYFAGLIISMVPTFILFAAFSNKIMTTLSIGGLKG